MAKKILCNCPVCGSLVDPDVFLISHEFNVVMRDFGGKQKRATILKDLPYQPTGQGSAPGKAAYTVLGDIERATYWPIIENAINSVKTPEYRK
jgi:hypothetical protein